MDVLRPPAGIAVEWWENKYWRTILRDKSRGKTHQTAGFFNGKTTRDFCVITECHDQVMIDPPLGPWLDSIKGNAKTLGSCISWEATAQLLCAAIRRRNGFSADAKTANSPTAPSEEITKRLLTYTKLSRRT